MRTAERTRIEWSILYNKIKQMFRSTPETEPEVIGYYKVFVRDLKTDKFNALKVDFLTYREARKAQKVIQRSLTCVSTWIEYRRKQFITRLISMYILDFPSNEGKVYELERLLDNILLRGCVMFRDIDKLEKLGVPAKKLVFDYLLHTNADSPFFKEYVRSGALSSELLMFALGTIAKYKI